MTPPFSPNEALCTLCGCDADHYAHLAGFAGAHSFRPSSPSPTTAPPHPFLCADCMHVHSSAEQDGVRSVFHRCRSAACDCREFVPISDVGGETPPADGVFEEVESDLPPGESFTNAEAAAVGYGLKDRFANARRIRELEEQLAESSRSLIEAQREREELEKAGNTLTDYCERVSRNGDVPSWLRGELPEHIAAWDAAVTSLTRTPPTPAPAETPHPDAAARKAKEAELCAKCGYTFAGHISNTGCVYPCWTPSGKHKPTTVAALAPTERTNG